ncbi:MAG: hypothetical protein Q4F56_00220 [Candidatus Saccharibacteria bacterium]|nr:hypothetical protein [Candidatus Saccharibacteria bacterium]
MATALKHATLALLVGLCGTMLVCNFAFADQDGDDAEEVFAEFAPEIVFASFDGVEAVWEEEFDDYDEADADDDDVEDVDSSDDGDDYVDANVDGEWISGSDFMFNGVHYDSSGYSYTYYSENVLPGGGLDIPGRHVGDEGYVCDGDGNLCLASDDLPYGTVVKVPFGTGTAVVYDCGSGYGNLDVYVSW